MKRFFSLFSLCLLLCASLSVTAQQDPEAGKLLDNLTKKYKSLNSFSAKYTYTLKDLQSQSDEAVSGSITVKGDKFRLKMAQQEIYNDETTIWTFMQDVNEVTISNYEPGETDEYSPTQILEMYKQGYKYRMRDAVTEGGIKYAIVELTPEDTSKDFFKVILKVNEKDLILSAWEVYEKQGRRYEYSIKEFKANINVSDAHFRFDPSKHPEVEVVDIR